MAYNVETIADYIIDRTNKDDMRQINNLELQKYLYFLESKYLSEYKESLFDSDIEKWKFGPVVPEIYHTYKKNGPEIIKDLPVRIEVVTSPAGFLTINKKPPFDPNIISRKDKKIIDDTLRILTNYKKFELVEITHEHEPWLEDKEKILAGEKGIKYSKPELARYFNENPMKKIWSHEQCK